MSTINVSCVDQVLNFTNMPVIASGDVNADKINFTFDSAWNGYSKICVFYRQKDDYFYGIIDGDGNVTVPATLLAAPGKTTFGVSGYKDTTVRTSNVLSYAIVEGAYTAVATDDYAYVNLGDIESKSNKITEFPDSGSPPDEQYPSAKLLYDAYVELTENNESINTSLTNIGMLLRDKIAVLDTFPTTQNQLLLAYSTKPLFIYSGSTSGNAINGHIYEITRSGTIPNFTYTVTDTGINVGSGGDINGKEDKSNKITEFPDSGSPTDEQYPSAKLLYDAYVELTENNESINTSLTNIGTLLRDKIAILNTFPTTSAQLFVAYASKPIFIYSGSTSGNAINGHIYEIIRNGTLGNYTYTVTDTGINVDSTGGSATLSKIWVALGDSKTDFDNNGVNRPDNYPYWIQQRNPKITLQNLGSAGGMITNERVASAGSSTILYPSIYTKATQITGTPDIITVAGGYNDWNWAVTLGTFTTDISGYDTSTAANVPSSGATFPLKNTFYMGVFRLAKYLTERFPTTPILWITPFPTTSKNNGGANGWNVCLPLSDYVQAIKDVCAYFSIPVCDIYTAGGLTPFTSSNLSTYWRNSDGVHPNGEGSKIYSYKIERMMRQTYQDWGKTW